MKRRRTRRLLTTKQAAEVAGYSPDHIGLLLRRKLIQGEKIGRDWLVDEKSLTKYIEASPKPGPKQY
jgi:excisionase family DNA binding protein